MIEMKNILIPVLMTICQLTIGTVALGATIMPATLSFDYDQSQARFYQTLDRAPVAGDVLKVIYNPARHDVLFQNQNRLFMRCSDDGWATCRDVEMIRVAKTGVFQGEITLSRHPGNLQIAFFTHYQNKYTWHVLWDSAYGNNFTVSVTDPNELEKHDRFAELETMELSGSL